MNEEVKQDNGEQTPNPYMLEMRSQWQYFEDWANGVTVYDEIKRERE